MQQGKQVIIEIEENINPKKSPEIDLMTGDILRNLARKFSFG